MTVKRPENPQKTVQRLLPHTAIMVAVFVYTIGGGYIFYWIEHPHRTASLQTAAIFPPTAAGPDSINDSRLTMDNGTHTTTMGTRDTTTTPVGTTLVVEGLVPMGHRRRPGRDIVPQTSTEYYYDDEEEGTGIEAQKKKLCNRKALGEAIRLAQVECVLAPSPQKNKDDEFRAHLCAKHLAQLSLCIMEPGFVIQDTSPPTTPPTTPTTTTTTTEAPTTVTQSTMATPLLHASTPMIHKQCESAVQAQDLTPSSYIFMAFTIISTIGYGHVAPVTTWGRVFCVIYGLFGIPLALLAIADQGRFLSAAIMFVFKKAKAVCKRRYHGSRRNASGNIVDGEGGDSEEESMPPTLLLVLFGAYMLIGGAVLTPFQKEWSYIDAVYFTFVSSSSIGFGDLLPQEGAYLTFTLLYVALGLALSTAAIDVFAGYLRRLHHFGAKIRNCANKLIWFGGEKVTLAQLVRNIGVQLGVPEDKINHLVEHFDEVVVTAIQQQAEITFPTTPAVAPLLAEEPKERPVEPKAFSIEIDFIDDKDDYIHEESP